MNESTLFGLAFLIYISAAFFYFSFLFSKKESLAKVGYNLGIFGLIVHTAALVIRTIESGHAPFTNMYESLNFFSCVIVLSFLIVEQRYKNKSFGVFILPVVVLLKAF